MPRWSVDLLSNRTQFVFRLGIVEAGNEKEAIEVAIRQLRIPSLRRNRITVTKISERDDD
jgi:hypothetical protein